MRKITTRSMNLFTFNIHKCDFDTIAPKNPYSKDPVYRLDHMPDVVFWRKQRGLRLWCISGRTEYIQACRNDDLEFLKTGTLNRERWQDAVEAYLLQEVL